MAASITVKGPAPYRVYQRDSEDRAAIGFSLEAASAGGRVEARVRSAAFSTPWTAVGTLEGETFSGELPRIPVGSFSFDVRVLRDDGIAAAATIEPVYVGDLWILAGQSNMEGCGKLIDMETPQEGISCFYMDDRWDIAAEPLAWLCDSVDPVNCPLEGAERAKQSTDVHMTRTQGAGLGLPFAKEVLRHTGVPVGLIMCAHGGTSMAQWDPALAHEGGNSLYGAMMRRVNKLGGRVKGCLWYQGESDANGDTGPLYLDRMIHWVGSLRRDVSDPRLPFIYAQLSVFYIWEPDASWWNRVQDDQLALESAIEAVAMVPTIDALMDDAIHVSTPSLKQIGRRMAWHALQLSYGVKVTEKGPRPGKMSWNGDRTELTIGFTDVNGRLDGGPFIRGFSLKSGDGHPLHRDTISSDGQAVVLRFEQPVPAGSELSHGVGFNPTCTVKDSQGIPVPVFGPITV